jgi:hypothetical protein
MSDSEKQGNSEKTITLRPSVKSKLPGIALGVILIPVLIGVFILYKYYREYHTTAYIIGEKSITARTARMEERVDLENIQRTTVEQGWLGSRLAFGTVKLHTNSRIVSLTGLENPQQISEMILAAAENERRKQAEMNRSKPREPRHPAGTADRLDYLTGLWQQGLLSNEDYEREKKHFE